MQGIEVSPATEHDIESAFSPEDLQPVDEHSIAIAESVTEIRRTAEDYLSRTGYEKQVNPILVAQLSASIARSRQSDMCIEEDGEAMVEISLGYIAQASSLWGQIMGAAKGEGDLQDEDNDRFSAGAD